MKQNGDGISLLVTDIPFWKADLGNRQRILSLVQYLNEKSIKLLILYLGRSEYKDTAMIETLGLSHCLRYLDDTAILHGKLNRVAPEKTGPLSEFYDPKIKARFDNFLSENTIKTIIVEYIHLDYLVSDLRQQYVTIIDTHDLMSHRAQKYERNNEVHHIIISEAEEMAVLDQYDYVLAIQKNEYDTMKARLKRAKLILVTHAVEPKNAAEIVFVSGTSHWKSIAWFIEGVWPQFAGTGMILHIYGSVCKNLKKYAKVKGVLFHGTVASLEEVYRRADIAINPVHFGGGLKIKSVEALAYGLPLITTSEGVNGLDDVRDKACLLANTQEEWIESLAILFFSKHLRHALTYNGLCFARKHFVGAECYGELANLLLSGGKTVQKTPEAAYRTIETEELLASLRDRLPEFLQHLNTLQTQDILRTEDEVLPHIEYIGEWSFELFERYRNSSLRKRMQGLKKVPLFGKSLIYLKRKLLKWDT